MTNREAFIDADDVVGEFELRVKFKESHEKSTQGIRAWSNIGWSNKRKCFLYQESKKFWIQKSI